MIYKFVKKIGNKALIASTMLVGLASCYDNTYEEFVAPSGNVNGIEPTTLFTTATVADSSLGYSFRSYSTDAVSYSWDFGDGNVSSEANPDVLYTEGGYYKVVLTTLSSDGLTSKDSTFVSPVNIDFNVGTPIDTEVAFENLTSGAKSLVWDFGDDSTVEWNSEEGTTVDTDFNPTHTYSTEEDAEVTLTVTNFLDEEVSLTKTVSGLVLSTIPQFGFVADGFDVQFTDESLYAETYAWDFGDGTTSTEASPLHTYTVNDEYVVSLTTTNAAGISKTITKNVIAGIVTIFAPNPTIINGAFDKIAKSSGSDCACSAWINKSVGNQAESTSGNDSDVVKFDNDEHDATYQEFEVVPNADYTIKVVVGFDDLTTDGSYPSVLELRVLAGLGYTAGYTPVYYGLGSDFPQDGYGYEDITLVEDEANNLLTETIAHPGTKDYITYEYTFNAGSNDSVALFMRGINGDGTPSDDKGHLYNSGDEEIQVDSITVEAVNLLVP